MNRYKYLIEMSKRNTVKLKGISSKTPLRALRFLPSVQQRLSDNLKYANRKVSDIESNECSKVLMYTGLNKDTAVKDINNLWKRNKSHFFVDLTQCEMTAEFKETVLSAGVPCTLTAAVKSKVIDFQLSTIELIFKNDENVSNEIHVDGKWKRMRENGNETQVLNAKVEFPVAGNYTLYAKVPLGESVTVKSFMIEPSLKRIKEYTNNSSQIN